MQQLFHKILKITFLEINEGYTGLQIAHRVAIR